MNDKNCSTRIPKFRRFVIQNFPFIEEDFDALTDYALICKVVEYLNKVIDSQNEVTAEMEALQNSFAELKSYVDNYFDNLDVQEEINNKLDQMAEDGQLADIIAQYLNVQAVISFNTIADMSASEHIVAGTTCRVLGNTNLYDGDGAYYKVRPVTSEDVIDGVQIVAITADNTIVAERIPDYNFNQINNRFNEYVADNEINALFNGVAGDGVTDDTLAIQALIDNNPYNTIYFPYGTYLISAPLEIKSGNQYAVNLHFEENATLKTNSSISSLIEVGNDTTSWVRDEKGSIVTIKGGVLDASNTTQAIKILSNRKQTIVQDTTIINISSYGIYTDAGDSGTSMSTDNVFTNLSINGDKTSNSVGLYLNSYDDKITHIRINGCRTSIRCDRAGHTFEDIHILGSWPSLTPSKAEYEATTGILLNGNGSYFMTDMYIDTMGVGININNTDIKLNINTIYYFWYASDATYSTKVLKLSATGNESVNINNFEIEFPSTGEFTGLDLSGTNLNYREYFAVFNQFHFTNVTLVNSRLSDRDWLLCRSSYNDDNLPLGDAWTGNFVAGSYYPIAVVRSGLSNPVIQLGNDQIIQAIINPSATPSIVIKNIANNAQSGVYNLALCNLAVDGDGKYYAYLCVKATTSRPKNICISNMKGWNAQIFTRRNFYGRNALTSPTVNVEVPFNS